MTRRAGRRAAIVVLAVIAAAAASPLVHAQDPRSAAAQDAARDWLAIVDRFDAEASFEAAGEPFRKALGAEGWVTAMKKVREPLGAVVQRTAVQTTFSNQAPGLAAGEYALIIFRTAFARRPVTREMVTLHVDAYRWQVVGYSIQQ